MPSPEFSSGYDGHLYGLIRDCRKRERWIPWRIALNVLIAVVAAGLFAVNIRHGWKITAYADVLIFLSQFALIRLVIRERQGWRKIRLSAEQSLAVLAAMQDTVYGAH